MKMGARHVKQSEEVVIAGSNLGKRPHLLTEASSLADIAAQI